MDYEGFYGFMRKREAIRLARAAGKPAPWADDPILQKYKFTNVKREHDRTSRLMREEFYTPNADAPKDVVLLNCAFARYFGTIEMMRAVGWQRRWDPARVKKIAFARRAKGERTFTGAYMINNGGVAGSKVNAVVDIILTGLWENRKAVVEASKGNSWQECIEVLQCVHGFGGTGFIAKETVLDTRYTNFWPVSGPADRDTWTPVGPGSMRGAARMLTGDKKPLNKYATLDVCLDIFAQRKKHWHGVDLELTDIQFQLCEYDKYTRIKTGEGRTRSLFRPTP